MAGALPASTLPWVPSPPLTLRITLDLQVLTFLLLPSLSFPEFLEVWHPNQLLDSYKLPCSGLISTCMQFLSFQ